MRVKTVLMGLVLSLGLGCAPSTEEVLKETQKDYSLVGWCRQDNEAVKTLKMMMGFYDASPEPYGFVCGCQDRGDYIIVDKVARNSGFDRWVVKLANGKAENITTKKEVKHSCGVPANRTGCTNCDG